MPSRSHHALFQPFVDHSALGVLHRRRPGHLRPVELCWLPAGPSAEVNSPQPMTEHHGSGRIDDPSNLADDRVSSSAVAKDDLVPVSSRPVSSKPTIGAWGSRRRISISSATPMPITVCRIEELTAPAPSRPGVCRASVSPFLIDCDYDAAERLLRHLYPQDFSASARYRIARGSSSSIRASSSGQQTPASAWPRRATCMYRRIASMRRPATEACHLHVAFHGCQQYTDLIEDDFYWDGGYNAWAEANRIVVLYPQTKPWDRPSDTTGFAGNPRGCWDWWGYSGADYYRQDGKQMQAVRAMIERMLGLDDAGASKRSPPGARPRRRRRWQVVGRATLRSGRWCCCPWRRSCWGRPRGCGWPRR